jgi:lipopolysaccharide export system permease protein
MLWRSALNPDILVGSHGFARSHVAATPVGVYQAPVGKSSEHQPLRYRVLEEDALPAWLPLVMVALALPFAAGNITGPHRGRPPDFFRRHDRRPLLTCLTACSPILGAINSWSPLLSAVTPSVLFLLTAVVIIWWVEKR